MILMLSLKPIIKAQEITAKINKTISESIIV